MNIYLYIYTLNCCRTRTVFLYWRRWWEQPRHHKERKARKLSSKARSFVLQRSLACWSCSQFSSTPLFPFPFLSLLFLTHSNIQQKGKPKIGIINQNPVWWIFSWLARCVYVLYTHIYLYSHERWCQDLTIIIIKGEYYILWFVKLLFVWMWEQNHLYQSPNANSKIKTLVPVFFSLLSPSGVFNTLLTPWQWHA